MTDKETFTLAMELMKRHNVGELSVERLLAGLETLLGRTGMDMLALWGVMCANKATERSA